MYIIDITYFPSIHAFLQKICDGYMLYDWVLSQTHKVGNIGTVAKFVFQYICSVFHYLHHLTLVNKKLDSSVFKMIIHKDCRLYWSFSFLISQLTQSWQYLNYCFAESL